MNVDTRVIAGTYKLACYKDGTVTATRIADQKTIDVPVDLYGMATKEALPHLDKAFEPV